MITIKEGNIDQRTALASSLSSLVDKYPLYVFDSDLASSSGMLRFAEKHPERFINCGIQEANMFGTAAGMASEGAIPFVHTFAAFASRRALDQFYVSALYNELPIKVISSDPGILNSTNGGTHVAYEDIGIISSLPNVKIIDFTDAVMIRKLLPEIIEDSCSYYLRLQRKTKKYIYSDDTNITIGKGIVLSEGNDVGIICNSSVALEQAIYAMKGLKELGHSVRLIDMFTISPIDGDLVLETARNCKLIVTVENSSIKNGLGTSVSDFLMENRMTTEVIKFGIPQVLGEVGDYKYLINKYGMDSASIIAEIQKRLSVI